MSSFQMEYRFSAIPWKFTGPGAWVFVSLPKKLSTEIRNGFKKEEAGWGRLTATARIGNTEWKTAIWFDTKRRAYLLPLKAEIRKKENVEAGRNIRITVSL